MRARLVVASHMSVGWGTGRRCRWTNERVVAEAAVGTVAGNASDGGGGRGTRTHKHTRTHTSTYGRAHTHTLTSAHARGAPPRRIAPPTHAQPANRTPRHDHVYHHPVNQRLSRARPAVDLFYRTPRSRPQPDETCVFPRHACKYSSPYGCNIILSGIIYCSDTITILYNYCHRGCTICIL